MFKTTPISSIIAGVSIKIIVGLRHNPLKAYGGEIYVILCNLLFAPVLIFLVLGSGLLFFNQIVANSLGIVEVPVVHSEKMKGSIEVA